MTCVMVCGMFGACGDTENSPKQIETQEPKVKTEIDGKWTLFAYVHNNDIITISDAAKLGISLRGSLEVDYEDYSLDIKMDTTDFSESGTLEEDPEELKKKGADRASAGYSSGFDNCYIGTPRAGGKTTFLYDDVQGQLWVLISKNGESIGVIYH